MNKMNLLLIVPTLAMGGMERVAVNTAAILSERYNITMVVFTMNMSAYKPVCEVININIPAKDGYLNKIINVVKRTRKLKKLKRELKIDVSFSFGNTANLVNALSKKADKSILSLHGYREISGSSVRKIINKMVFRIADNIVCVAEKMAREVVSLFNLSEDKVLILHNPYDFESITKQASLPVQFTVRHPAIVTMGRLEKVKGFHHLLQAFALIHRELPEATLVFVGDGSKRKKLEEMVGDLGLLEQVTFMGFQANPYSYLKQCDLFAMSSIHEGFPNALIEAMACSLPIVATDCNSGPREILSETYYDITATEIKYADYGILVPPFASDDSNESELDQLFADAILRLLKDKEIYKKYMEKAQERAQVFSFQSYADKIINIIEG